MDWLAFLDSFPAPPRRVVSLVPSVTESIFDLGWGDRLVGVTDYCKYPEGKTESLPRLGGTKTPKIQEILDLSPDLVIANREENDKRAVEDLMAAGVPTWITFPRSVTEALALLYALARLFRSPSAARQIKALETVVDWTRAAGMGSEGFDYFCPVWEGRTAEDDPWWMTFNAETYAHSVLALFGGRNVFANRHRRDPLDADLNPVSGGESDQPQRLPGTEGVAGDTRYPRVSLDEVRSTRPEVILLPDEPFSYSSGDRAKLEVLFSDTPAGQTGRVYLVEGSLITWHGTRLGLAIQRLPALFSEITGQS